MALPRFNRTYQQLKAPENVPPVDLSKAFTMMSTSMANAMANRLKAQQAAQDAAYKRSQEIMDYGLEFTTKQQAELYKNLKTAGVNNPEIMSLGNSIIDNMTDWQLAAKKSSSREEQAYALENVGNARAKLNELLTIVEYGKAADKTFQEDFAADFNKVGQQGGVALTGDDDEFFRKYQLGMFVRNGVGKNLKEQYIVGDDGQWKIRYQSDLISSDPSFKDQGYVEVDAAEFFRYTPDLVPETDENIRKKLKEKKIWEPGTGVGKLYLDQENITSDISNDGRWITEKIPVNKQKFDADVAATITPIAAGHLASGNMAQIAWRETILPAIQDKEVINIETGEKTTWGKLMPKLTTGDGTIGGSKWDINSQTYYEMGFRQYAFDMIDQKDEFVTGKTVKNSQYGKSGKSDKEKAASLKLKAFDQYMENKGGKRELYNTFVKGPGRAVVDKLNDQLENLSITNEVAIDPNNDDIIIIDIAGPEPGKLKIDIKNPEKAIKQLRYAISGDYTLMQNINPLLKK